MWDIFRSLFGFQGNKRGEPNVEHHFEWGNMDDPTRFGQEDNNFRIFSDPMGIHSFFAKEMDEMMKQMFNFGDFESSVAGINANDFFSEPQKNEKPEKLREYFLKPNVIEKEKKEDKNLDGCISNSDIQHFLERPNEMENETDLTTVPQQPHFSFQSVTVRTIRRPNGSIETIRTVRDNTGREETTVTQQAPTDPNLPALEGPRSSNDDILKFFRF